MVPIRFVVLMVRVTSVVPVTFMPVTFMPVTFMLVPFMVFVVMVLFLLWGFMLVPFMVFVVMVLFLLWGFFNVVLGSFTPSGEEEVPAAISTVSIEGDSPGVSSWWVKHSHCSVTLLLFGQRCPVLPSIQRIVGTIAEILRNDRERAVVIVFVFCMQVFTDFTPLLIRLRLEYDSLLLPRNMRLVDVEYREAQGRLIMKRIVFAVVVLDQAEIEADGSLTLQVDNTKALVLPVVFGIPSFVRRIVVHPDE